MKTTGYIGGILLFTAIILLLTPIQEITSAREVPISIIVALGSYGLLLIARRPRRNAHETITTSSGKTAWYLAITGVIFGSIVSFAASHALSEFVTANAAFLVCLYYGLALSMLVFSFINRRKANRSEHNHLPRHRFNTLEMSV